MFPSGQWEKSFIPTPVQKYPVKCAHTYNDPDLIPVDITCTKQIHNHGQPNISHDPSTLQEWFLLLPLSLRQICGSKIFPHDDGFLFLEAM